MKKITLSIIAVLAFGFANAQEVKFGLKGGINLSTFTGDVGSTSTRVGFQVGGFAEIKVTDKFSVQPELLYSAQGAKEKGGVDVNGDMQSAEVIYKLGYINVPIMAKYYVADKFSLEAGPQIGFLTSSKAEAKILGFSKEVDMEDAVKSIDFGLNFGAGLDFTENFSAGVRYNLGLSDINNEKDSTNKIHNSVFSLSVGYKF
jgi:opacity protein-like surface antigen